MSPPATGHPSPTSRGDGASDGGEGRPRPRSCRLTHLSHLELSDSAAGTGTRAILVALRKEGHMSHGGAPLAALLVNLKRKDDTLRCLASLTAADYPALDVILVDNASQDDTCA